MAKILCIETSTEICSVALSIDGKMVDMREEKEGNQHSKLLAVFVDELFKEHQLNENPIDAIAVSKGPGSYTGLRIGVSLAKGLCFAQNIPLLSVNSLKSLAAGVLQNNLISNADDSYILCPMIDARRMEVYAALYDTSLNTLRETTADIIDENSYQEYLRDKKMVFFGNGAAKCKDALTNNNSSFIDDFSLSASYLCSLAEEAFKNETFEDVAYFEPFYLKDFVAVTSKKKLF